MFPAQSWGHSGQDCVNSRSQEPSVQQTFSGPHCDSSHRPPITLPKKYQPLPPEPANSRPLFPQRYTFPKVQGGSRWEACCCWWWDDQGTGGQGEGDINNQSSHPSKWAPQSGGKSHPIPWGKASQKPAVWLLHEKYTFFVIKSVTGRTVHLRCELVIKENVIIAGTERGFRLFEDQYRPPASHLPGWRSITTHVKTHLSITWLPFLTNKYGKSNPLVLSADARAPLPNVWGTGQPSSQLWSQNVTNTKGPLFFSPREFRFPKLPYFRSQNRDWHFPRVAAQSEWCFLTASLDQPVRCRALFRQWALLVHTEIPNIRHIVHFCGKPFHRWFWRRNVKEPKMPFPP